MNELNIFIGYDSKESVAYHVLAHSIITRAKKPVSITPVMLSQLKNIFTRKNQGTTEFSLSRFLVPYLSNFKGWSLFMDCDMLCKIDINEILKNVNDDYKSIYVVKHDYEPKTLIKATGNQTTYPRKNWSSLILFNNDRCKVLSKEYCNRATPLDLHRFNWLNDSDIGELPLEYNWLVGEYEKNEKAKIYHYTLGTPCFETYKNCDHSLEWHNELNEMTNFKQF